MRSVTLLSCTIACVLIAVCHGAPAPTLDRAETSAIEPQNDKEVIEIINLSNFGQTDRDKRDINMLRQLFPGLAQIFDRLVQEIISQSFRVIGRVLLQNGGLGGLLGGGGGGDGESEGRSGGRVSVSLPTFPPDEDEDEDEDNDDEDNNTVAAASTAATTRTKRDTEGANNEDNSLSGSESQNREVRVKFEDQDTAASNNGPQPAEESIDDPDADRNKRFLPFGIGGGDHNGAAAGGGSGNFLFDIIRSTADRAARAAGTVYRMVAGTESLGLGLTATASQTKTVSPSIAQLVAGSGSGSGGTEAGDEKANGAVEVDVGKGADGYTEGVPGPITRLFVIANRGIANLIQDLILRLAQTSERIVNFKARLVTALI